MAYQFVSEGPTPAQRPLFESATQVTDYKTQKIYDSNAHKELISSALARTSAVRSALCRSL
jgi:hypothetical protein